MKGSKKCSWPPEGAEDVQSLVKNPRPAGANWEILCEASKIPKRQNNKS